MLVSEGGLANTQEQFRIPLRCQLARSADLPLLAPVKKLQCEKNVYHQLFTFVKNSRYRTKRVFKKTYFTNLSTNTAMKHGSVGNRKWKVLTNSWRRFLWTSSPFLTCNNIKKKSRLSRGDKRLCYKETETNTLYICGLICKDIYLFLLSLNLITNDLHLFFHQKARRKKYSVTWNNWIKYR